MTPRERHYEDAATYVDRAASHAHEARDALGDLMADLLYDVARILREIPKSTEVED